MSGRPLSNQAYGENTETAPEVHSQSNPNFLHSSGDATNRHIDLRIRSPLSRQPTWDRKLTQNMIHCRNQQCSEYGSTRKNPKFLVPLSSTQHRTRNRRIQGHEETRSRSQVRARKPHSLNTSLKSSPSKIQKSCTPPADKQTRNKPLHVESEKFVQTATEEERKHVTTQHGLLIFLWNETHSETQSWKSSKIFACEANFVIFSCSLLFVIFQFSVHFFFFFQFFQFFSVFDIFFSFFHFFHFFTFFISFILFHFLFLLSFSIMFFLFFCFFFFCFSVSFSF